MNWPPLSTSLGANLYKEEGLGYLLGPGWGFPRVCWP